MATVLPKSGDYRIDGLINPDILGWNYVLGKTTVYYTFSIPDPASGQWNRNQAPFNASEKKTTMDILEKMSAITGITFAETNNFSTADLRFSLAAIIAPAEPEFIQTGSVESGTYSYKAAFYLNGTIATPTDDASPESGLYQSILQGIGLVMGLYYASAGKPALPQEEQKSEFTVMAFDPNYQLNYQPYDLLALQWLYGGDGLRGTKGLNSTNGPSLTGGGDLTPPRVNVLTPADGATSVGVGADIQLTFNEPIKRGTGDIVLKKTDGTVVETFNAFTSTRVSIADSTVNINPTSNLEYGTTYNLEISSGSVIDLTGNRYLGINNYNFTTQPAPDTTAPTVLTFSPADEFVGAAVGSNIVVTFNEPIQLGSTSITLKKSDGTVVETYNAFTPKNLSISGNKLTIDPTVNLSNSTGYKVEFAFGSVRDLSGNGYVGTTNYNFTTATPDTTSPRFVSISPLMPSPADNIVISFDEPIQRGVGEIYLETVGGKNIEVFNMSSSKNISILGSTLTINPTMDLQPDSKYVIRYSSGVVKDMAGNPINETLHHTITTRAEPITLLGTAGNDLIRPSSTGNDVIDGGKGFDKVNYAGKREYFTITKNDSQITLFDKSGGLGTDVLLNVERIQFQDLGVAFDIDGNAGKAYRLYQAAFDRTPDVSGLGWQIKALDEGVTLLQVANGFMNSAEFQSLYGATVSNAELVNLLYQNVLHRLPEQAGYDYWLNMLNKNELSRAEVLYYFSDSAENQAQVIGNIQNGIECQLFPDLTS